MIRDNLTKLLMCDAVKSLLALNGFCENGSDFEWFRALCHCIEIMPEHPAAGHCRLVLQQVLGCALSPSEQACHAIWQFTAEVLLLEPPEKIEERMSQLPKTEFNCLPCTKALPTQAALDLSELLSPCRLTDWKTYQAEKNNALDRFLSPSTAPFLRLSTAIGFCKPNLYHINQILAGERMDDAMWQLQQLRFLFSYCEVRKIKPVVALDGTAEEWIRLLQNGRLVTALPNFIWMPKNIPSLRELSALATWIMANRSSAKQEGPPILLAIDASDQPSLPPALLCQVILSSSAR